MNEIVRTPERTSLWDAFNDMDSLFWDWRPGRVSTEAGRALVPALDVVETDGEYLVKAELPGVKKEDLEISVHDGMLTINAHTKYEHEDKDNGRVIRQERRYGKYVRSLRLGNDVDTEKVKAEYKDGVLELRLPKVEEVKPKRIDVKVA